MNFSGLLGFSNKELQEFSPRNAKKNFIFNEYRFIELIIYFNKKSDFDILLIQFNERSEPFDFKLYLNNAFFYFERLLIGLGYEQSCYSCVLKIYIRQQSQYEPVESAKQGIRLTLNVSLGSLDRVF